MTRRLRRLLPSSAMVVALTALVLSLGGSAYALVVTGKTIRNNSVTGADIRQRSLTGNDVEHDRIGGGS
jgi:peptidoglycan/LPS O-acetylase OafA/YrhL